MQIDTAFHYSIELLPFICVCSHGVRNSVLDLYLWAARRHRFAAAAARADERDPFTPSAPHTFRTFMLRIPIRFC